MIRRGREGEGKGGGKGRQAGRQAGTRSREQGVEGGSRKKIGKGGRWKKRRRKA